MSKSGKTFELVSNNEKTPQKKFLKTRFNNYVKFLDTHNLQ